MPSYEYQCKACGHTLEEFHSIMDPPRTRCPKCDTDNLARVMGTGVGLIFRGTGFYLTDYKKSGGTPSSPSAGTSEKKSPGSGDSSSGGSPTPGVSGETKGGS